MGRAIAVHGGAGIDPCLPMERQQEAKDLLLHYINLGVSALKASIPAIDVVELMVEELEKVFTWGYKMVSPRRVLVQRNTKKCGNMPLKFHLMERLHVVKIAAGMTHSTVLSDDGSLFYWVSSDPNLHCQQLYSMTSSDVVSVSAGKYWTAIATLRGDVYTWDGQKHKGDAPILHRIHGIKHATSVSVGEIHFLAVSTNYIPKYAPKCFEEIQATTKEYCEEDDEIEDDDAEDIYGQPMHDNSCRLLVDDQGIMAAGAINAIHGFRSSVEELLQIYIHSDSGIRKQLLAGSDWNNCMEETYVLFNGSSS